MFDHVSVGVDDPGKAREIYDGALGALGLKMVFEHGDVAVAYGTEHPSFWVQKPDDQKPASSGNGTHVCFSAATRQAVHDFYDAAIRGGAEDAGAPGPRPEYTPTYYAAFSGMETATRLKPCVMQKADPDLLARRTVS